MPHPPGKNDRAVDAVDRARRHSDTALAIRLYFGARFVEWAEQRRVTLGGVVTVDSRQLMKALMNLCNYMRADGQLTDAVGRPRGIDGRYGLAAIMHVNRETAMRIFAGLEAEGCLRSMEARDEKGYKQPTQRWLQAPAANPLSRPSNASPDLGQDEAKVGEAGILSRRNGGPRSEFEAEPGPNTLKEEGKRGRETRYLPADIAPSADVDHRPTHSSSEPTVLTTPLVGDVAGESNVRESVPDAERFLTECCYRSDTAKVRGYVLEQVYGRWRRAAGLSEVSASVLTEQLLAAGLSRDVKWFYGVSLKEEA